MSDHGCYSNSGRLIDAVLFDAGGTLIRRVPSSPQKLARFLADVGIAVSAAAANRAWYRGGIWAAEQQLRELGGAPRMDDDEFERRMVESAFRAPELGLAEETTAEAVERFCSDATQSAWAEITGAKDTLRGLRNAGFTLGLVSNFTTALRDILRDLDLWDFFTDHVISDEVGVAKPDPKILAIACERLRLPVARSVYVGDHPFDVVCAKRAGLFSLWVAPEFAWIPDGTREEPDWRVDSITDVPRLFGVTA